MDDEGPDASLEQILAEIEARFPRKTATPQPRMAQQPRTAPRKTKPLEGVLDFAEFVGAMAWGIVRFFLIGFATFAVVGVLGFLLVSGIKVFDSAEPEPTRVEIRQTTPEPQDRTEYYDDQARDGLILDELIDDGYQEMMRDEYGR